MNASGKFSRRAANTGVLNKTSPIKRNLITRMRGAAGSFNPAGTVLVVLSPRIDHAQTASAEFIPPEKTALDAASVRHE
jgi:hypothetical protein